MGDWDEAGDQLGGISAASRNLGVEEFCERESGTSGPYVDGPKGSLRLGRYGHLFEIGYHSHTGSLASCN